MTMLIMEENSDENSVLSKTSRDDDRTLTWVWAQRRFKEKEKEKTAREMHRGLEEGLRSKRKDFDV